MALLAAVAALPAAQGLELAVEVVDGALRRMIRRVERISTLSESGNSATSD